MQRSFKVISALAVMVTLVAFQNCSSGSLPANVNTSNASSVSPTSVASAISGCNYNGAVVASGTVEANSYFIESAPEGTVCPAATTLTCTNGVWSDPSGNTGSSIGVSTGSDSAASESAYSSCSGTATCSFLGTTVNSGATTTGYSASSVPYGTACSTVQATLTCTNGAFTSSLGDSASKYISATCKVAAPPYNYGFTGTVQISGSSQGSFSYTPSNSVTGDGMPYCGTESPGACTHKGATCWVYAGEVYGFGYTDWNYYTCQ